MEKTCIAALSTQGIMALSTVLFVGAHTAQADIIAFTSFEEPAAFSGLYIDTRDSYVNHALEDNAGQPLVNWTQKALELGFSSSYTNTRNGVGLTDGDSVGVTDTMSAHGTQSFMISDADGLMTTTLDTVSLIGYFDPRVSLELFIAREDWETSDHVRVWATVDSSIELDLFNTAGQDIDNLPFEDRWMPLSLDLSGFSTATLAFEVDSNSRYESVYFDAVKFTGTVAPLPSSLVLGTLGLGLVACLGKF